MRRFGLIRVLGSLSSFVLVTGLTSAVLGTPTAGAVTQPLKLFVAYADNLRANPINFPTPFESSPGVTFIGAGPSDPGGAGWDSGAIMIQNPNSTAQSLSDVSVNLNRPGDGPGGTNGPVYDLWGSSITVKAHGTTILAQTSGNNFDTSDSAGIEPCGTAAPASFDPPLVTITPTVGSPTTFTDGGHVLDTSGYDSACLGNESIQWTTPGKAACAGSTLTLAPPSAAYAPGATATLSATFKACALPLANQSVNFTVSSGPDGPGSTSPVSGSRTTNSSGVATFTYSDSANSNAQGIDYTQASVTNTVGTINSNAALATFETASLSLVPSSGLPGATINYTGASFQPNEAVKLFSFPSASVQLGVTTASSTGTISGSFVVPVPTSSGPQSAVQAVGQTSSRQGWAPFSMGCTDDWLGGNGNFNAAANWSTGAVPGASDLACIILSGNYTVTMNQSNTLGSLILGNGSAATTQTLEMPGGN